MKRISILLTAVLVAFITFNANAQRPEPDQIESDDGILTIQPIQHGTVVFSWNDNMVYVDPTGGSDAFEGLDSPDIILVSHAHGDHMDIETLAGHGRHCDDRPPIGSR